MGILVKFVQARNQITPKYDAFRYRRIIWEINSLKVHNVNVKSVDNQFKSKNVITSWNARWNVVIKLSYNIEENWIDNFSFDISSYYVRV